MSYENTIMFCKINNTLFRKKTKYKQLRKYLSIQNIGASISLRTFIPKLYIRGFLMLHRMFFKYYFNTSDVTSFTILTLLFHKSSDSKSYLKNVL